MATVATLVPLKYHPDPQLLEVTEALLEKVRRGEVRSIAYATVNDDDSVTTAMSPNGDPFKMLGALERLKLRYYQLHVETL